MKRFILIIFVIIAFSNTLKADEVFYYITFSSPEHTVGQVPVTGNSPTRPSQIVFGSPIVSSSLGLLQDQPLVFNTAGNSPSFYYDQIRLNMNNGTGFYYISFDVVTQNLIGSTNHFVFLFDSPKATRIEFKNNGFLSMFKRPYQDGELLHFEVLLDFPQKWITVYINGVKYLDGSTDISYFRSIRFSLGLVSSGSSPNHDTYVGLDNIIVADHVVAKPCNPVADAGEDQGAYADVNCSAEVTLDGSASYDPDGLELTCEWSWTIDGELYKAYGITPTIELPVGEHTIQLIVNNGECDSEPNEVMVTVFDKAAPELEITVDPAILWPPNHKMVLVTPNIIAWDNCSGEPQVGLVSITSNEPNDGQGDGHTSDDILIDGDGNIYLRAERSSTGDDRVYTITYEAMDAIGNNTQASATVTVPHDKRNIAK